MALTQGARNKIKSFVQEIKKKLIVEFEAQLQSLYGIRPDGTCLMVEELTSKESSIIQTASLLRGRLEYIKTTIAGKEKDAEAVAQLIREQAFTILNRFAALRMAEERNIIRPSIQQNYNSEGFQVYDQLTGGATSADQFSRYTWYLNAIFDELAVDLPAIFDRYSPYALLFPSEKVVLELLEIINDHQLVNYREEGYQLMNLWEQDETIGWIYQYYNSREEISAMREASGAPRNSRELAVRNQFFTPRYVVQFLVDNSLGQQWYEMTQGRTELPERCEYMVKRPKVIFLEKGRQIPEEKEADTHYIDFRLLKDPREILMLDPACGSMHFGLYCFDLYEIIYTEAWDNFKHLMHDLRDKWTREEFIKHIPDMILRYNIHGVDIDPRAIQMAGLSLWLRAQRYYDGLGLQPKERPSISKSNLVVAEPLPGDEKILTDFTQDLPGPIGKLLRVIWGKMKLAGETGLLLKIEEELKKEIEITKEEWKLYKNSSAEITLFDAPEQSEKAKMAAIYGKGQKITKDFFDTAEEEVLSALEKFAENAQGVNAFQKLLFAEDTARGFSFIELCRKRYDVIVMNPPFGAGSISTEEYYKCNFPIWGKNILCCFFERMSQLCKNEGSISAIFDRTVFEKSSYEQFRISNFIGKIKSILDTGWGVLDANVETTTVILDKKFATNGYYIPLHNVDDKESHSKLQISKYYEQESCSIRMIDSSKFSNLPNSVIGVNFEEFEIEAFNSYGTIRSSGTAARKGNDFVSFEHYRNYWEIGNISLYRLLYNGGVYSCFYKPISSVVKNQFPNHYYRSHKSINLRNADYQYKSGVGYGKFGDYLDAHVLREGLMFTSEGLTISKISNNDALSLLSYLNSNIARYLLNLYSGLHKQAGYVNLLPIPDIKVDLNKIVELIKIKRRLCFFDETVIEYRGDLIKLLNLTTSFASMFNKIIELFNGSQEKYQKYINDNNDTYEQIFSVDENAKKKLISFSKKLPNDPISELFTVTSLKSVKDMIIPETLMNIVGVAFGRWNLVQILKSNEPDENIFSKLNLHPDVFITRGNKILSETHLKKEYMDNETLSNKCNSILREINFSAFQNIQSEIDELFESLPNYFLNYNSYFAYHLSRYTKNRRASPIYWPLATKSTSYVIWVYFPELTENTLFAIVTNLLNPKINMISEEVDVLMLNSSSKELNENKEFLTELEDFKEELLRIAKFYRPNQDDGVLITAAPLHNLFRHTKWKKATEACWKKLEKGEYDWAHLAYSIWPDRVREKCKKDLSMAIAHGLEDICEIKPKEKKVRVKKGVTVNKQAKLL